MRIDSATDDTIRVSLTVAIRFTDASVNRYTPNRNVHQVQTCNNTFPSVDTFTHAVQPYAW